MVDEAYDSDRAGHSNGDKRSDKRTPWRGTSKADDELTMVRVPAGLVREFDAWFESQMPDARQRPSKDPYVARLFREGLDLFKDRFPPVESLESKFAALDKKAS